MRDKDSIEGSESVIRSEGGEVGEAAFVGKGRMSTAVEQKGVSGSEGMDAAAADVTASAKDVKGELRGLGHQMVEMKRRVRTSNEERCSMILIPWLKSNFASGPVVPLLKKLGRRLFFAGGSKGECEKARSGLRPTPSEAEVGYNFGC